MNPLRSTTPASPTPPGPVTSRPTVTAVALNHNGGDRILTTIVRLTEQTYPLHEIVVIDNGSTDGSPDRIRERFADRTDLRIVARDNDGLTVARNTAVQQAQTDLVFMVDADVYAEPDCVERLVAAQVETGAAVVCPRVRLLPESDIVQCEGAAAHFLGGMIMRHGHHPLADLAVTPAWVDGCIGASFLVSRSAALDAGGWNPAIFLYFEDHDFCLRMRARGHHFYCDPRAVVFHDRITQAGLTFRGKGHYPARRAFLNIRDRWTVVLTTFHWRTLIILTPALLLYETACMAVVMRSGWVRPWLGAVAWHVRNARTTWRQRRQVQLCRRVPDRQLLVGGRLPFVKGFASSPLARTGVTVLSAILNTYWLITRRAVG
jgi:GT2 family glycosyltransferase